MRGFVKIVPSDGPLGRGTKVYTIGDDGAEAEVHNVRGITVRFEPDAYVQATLDMIVTPETIIAEPLLSLATVKAAADLYGYRLQPDDEPPVERPAKHRFTLPVDTVDL